MRCRRWSEDADLCELMQAVQQGSRCGSEDADLCELQAAGGAARMPICASCRQRGVCASDKGAQWLRTPMAGRRRAELRRDRRAELRRDVSFRKRATKERRH